MLNKTIKQFSATFLPFAGLARISFLSIMKHEYKKHEKQFYAPGSKPEFIDVPPFKFFSLKGQGNPNEPFFADYIETLYALSYGVKMSPKQGFNIPWYFEYSVYPLEGIWDITEAAQKAFSGIIDKKDLVFNLMIRQPDFVTEEIADDIIRLTQKKKKLPLLDQVKFELIKDGPSIQMLHTGSYDSEPESFRIMEEFAVANNYKRLSKIHREIYLSDARKTSTEKLKTILRFQVETLNRH